MGEGVVPGGQEFDEPPQQEHRNPSTAQYFQYSQLKGSSAAALLALPGVLGALGSAASAASAREERSTGSSGINAAPVRIFPSVASMLRREVCRASERDEFSNRRSSERIPVPFKESARARGSVLTVSLRGGAGP